jgi:hypothetical protein
LFQGIGATCKKSATEQGLLQQGCSDGDKLEIVGLHNELRSSIANGLEKRGKTGPWPAAANMMELVWDHEVPTYLIGQYDCLIENK